MDKTANLHFNYSFFIFASKSYVMETKIDKKKLKKDKEKIVKSNEIVKK